MDNLNNLVRNSTTIKNATLSIGGIDQDDKNCILIPSITDYILGFNTYLYIAVPIANLLVLINIILYLKNVKYVIENTPNIFTTKTMILCGVYTIVSLSSLISIWIPKTFLLTDTISHLTFMYCAYIFYCLLFDYTEGESNFIKTADNLAFNMRTPPLCCCIPFLKRSAVSKGKLTLTRWMVLQLSIVQTILFVTLNILFVEEKRIYDEVFLYFLPFIILSIIIGVWGLNITVRMIAPYFTEYKLMGKYVILQLVLILNKFQPPIADWIVNALKLDCNYPVTPFVLRNVTVQLMIIIQMLLLLICAQKLYKIPSKR